MNKALYILIHPSDNVAVVLERVGQGEVLTFGTQKVIVREEIPAGHKVAVSRIASGNNVIKYGYPIGHAVVDLEAGDWVNEKRIKTNLSGVEEYSYSPELSVSTFPQRNLTFNGYRRKDGLVGTRNEIWIVPTVGCVNGSASQLAETLRNETGLKGVDAIVAFPHSYGCSQLGEDHENTRKILRDMVLHPNAGGVLVVGLGCENNQLDAFKTFLGDYDPERVRFMECQKVSDEYEEGMKLLRELYKHTANCQREPIPLSELKVGLKCGGSDGFSGITANPLLGFFSDFLTSQGGTTVLTEVPEMFGAETILMNRCATPVLFDQTVRLINGFKEYYEANNQPVYENPSPGNKAGGISTLEEKSLGCTQKSGQSPVCGVVAYGDLIREKGLNLLSAPGNDLVAATALASSGCQLILFTTGRGTPFGCYVPTIKVSTNSLLYQSKPGWIDFNAGILLEGKTMEEANELFIDYIIRVASGEKVRMEKNGYHEFAIFKSGVTL